MKANELRLGNLMQDQQGNILKVIGIVEGSISYHVVDRSKFPLENGWSAFPIPLTEEILIKAGFSKSDSNFFNEYQQKIGAILFSVMISIEGKFFFIPSVHLRWSIELNSLHRLQNLFFALTGEEIEITC